MALGILEILYIIFIIIGIIIQILLYREKNESKNNIFIINMLFVILLSYIAFTSFAINFTVERTLAIVFAVIALLAVGVKVKVEKLAILSKVMLSISIIGNFLLLFL